MQDGRMDRRMDRLSETNIPTNNMNNFVVQGYNKVKWRMVIGVALTDPPEEKNNGSPIHQGHPADCQHLYLRNKLLLLVKCQWHGYR